MRILRGGFLDNSITLFFLIGKITRSLCWCVSTCQLVRRTPIREDPCPCRASWTASHTSVTSQHWPAARGARWAYTDIFTQTSQRGGHIPLRATFVKIRILKFERNLLRVCLRENMNVGLWSSSRPLTGENRTCWIVHIYFNSIWASKCT